MKNKVSLLLVCMLALSPAWSVVVVQDLSHLTQVTSVITPIDRDQIHPHREKTESGVVKTSRDNWSGYAATSTEKSVSYATGTWTVPPLVATKDNTYCAVWVGIDGDGSASVEQIGTAHNWVNGAREHYAWFEMYPHGAYKINGFPVENGDQITASVVYEGEDTFKMILTNHTQAVTTTIPTEYTKSSSAQRSSAEWVVEAPYSGSILQLADYGIVTFSDCSTIINGVSGGIESNDWPARVIDMDHSHIIKATASKLNDEKNSFNVAWDHE